MPRSSISAWKPRFVITVTATWSTSWSSARTATIWSPSTTLALLVDREHPVAVAVERDAEVEPRSSTVCCKSARSVAPQPTLMFSPFGSSPIACTSAPQRSNASGARPEYAPFAQSTAIRKPVRSEPKRSMMCVEVGVGRDLDVLDPPLVDAGRRGEQRLDLLLGRVGELVPLWRRRT